jgi:hypothetical protein
MSPAYNYSMIKKKKKRKESADQCHVSLKVWAARDGGTRTKGKPTTRVTRRIHEWLQQTFSEWLPSLLSLSTPLVTSLNPTCRKRPSLYHFPLPLLSAIGPQVDALPKPTNQIVSWEFGI